MTKQRNLQEKAALEPTTTAKTLLTINDHRPSKGKNFKATVTSHPLRNKLRNQLISQPPKWKSQTCPNSSRPLRTKPHLNLEKSSLILLFRNMTHQTKKSVKQSTKIKTQTLKCFLKIKPSVTTLLNILKCRSCSLMNITLLFLRASFRNPAKTKHKNRCLNFQRINLLRNSLLSLTLIKKVKLKTKRYTTYLKSTNTQKKIVHQCVKRYRIREVPTKVIACRLDIMTQRHQIQSWLRGKATP